MHPIHKHMSSRMKARKADERYDAKEAYNKNLSGKARLHYLENDIADKGMSMKSPMDMGHKAPANMKAPMKKAGKKAIKKVGKAALAAAGGMVPGIGAAVTAAKAAKAVGKAIKGKKSPADMKAPMKKQRKYSGNQPDLAKFKKDKQEKRDLMDDNPVVKDASGRRRTAKESKSTFVAGKRK